MFLGRPFVGSPWFADPGMDHAFRTYVTYAFSGFFAPVDNEVVNSGVKAGGSVPVKFILGGDQGLDVLADGYPQLVITQCDPAAAVDPIEETTTDTHSGLTYDAGTDTYTYVWKTNKGWKGTCRELAVKLADGSDPHLANFKFIK